MRKRQYGRCGFKRIKRKRHGKQKRAQRVKNNSPKLFGGINR